MLALLLLLTASVIASNTLIYWLTACTEGTAFPAQKPSSA